MCDLMSLLEQREGVSSIKVLSAVSNLESSEVKVIQKNIVKNTILSKGSVSNNCKKLVDEGFLKLENDIYSLNKEKLLESYRTHFEDYLRRRKVPKEFEHYNEIRTLTKMNINDIFEEEVGDLITNIMTDVLSTANEDGQINTIRDLFHRVDCLIGKITEDTYNSEEENDIKKHMMMLAVSMDRTPEYISSLEKFELKNTTVYKISEDLKEVL